MAEARKHFLHRGIEADDEYYVLAVSFRSYRVIDRDGEPILYPKEIFVVVDTAIPAGWRFVEFAGGAYSLEPAAASGRGFYEDLFGSDGDREAQRRAQAALRGMLEAARTAAAEPDRLLIQVALDRFVASLVVTKDRST